MALFQILRGKAANLAKKAFHDGYAYLTPDDGAFYIDAEVEGNQKRIRINPDDYITEQNKKNQQHIWRGTKAEYDAIKTKDADTLYLVTDDAAAVTGGSGGSGGNTDEISDALNAHVSDKSIHTTASEKAKWDGKLDKSGGALTGALVAQSNTNYEVRQVRNVIISTGEPTGGENGDIWIQYLP